MTATQIQTETRCAPDPTRALLRVTGEDRVTFLQGLLTQDIKRVVAQGIGYGALLTPQGKLIADFLIVAQADAILLDTDGSVADEAIKRLSMFKLRAKVQIERVEMPVTRGLGPAPDGAVRDPRHGDLGWRLYGAALTRGEPVDWQTLHVQTMVPRLGLELVPGDSFILELGFERLGGVDFRKGCYVGQEVTARMHHKTEVRRALFQVRLPDPVAPGTPVVMDDGREAGAVYSQAQGIGLALLRKDRIDGTLRAGAVSVTVL